MFKWFIKNGTSHDDHVEVTGKHPDRVEPCFAFGFRRRAGVAHLVAGDAQNLAGRHERQERARRRLGEIQHRTFVRQQLDQKVLSFAALGEHTNHVGNPGQLFQQVDVQLC